MKITGAAAAQKPERERRWRNESTTPMENAFASQLEQRLPPPPEQAASSSASDVVSTAGSPSDASAERLTVDDLPPRMTLSPAANDDGGALALPEGMTLPAGAQAEEPIAAQGPPAPTKPEPEDGAKDAKLAPDTFGANTNLSAAGGLVGVPGPNANAGNGADDVAGGLGLGVEPSAARTGAGRDPAALGSRGDKDERNGAAAPAHSPAPTPPPAAAVYDTAPSVAAAAPVHAAASVEIPQPPHHSGSARASITVGEGDDRVALRIAAHGAHVRVTASTASQQLANELNRDAGELREALRQHGLSLTEMHAGSSGDTPSQPQSQPQPQPQPQPHDPEAAPGPGPARASASPSITATQPEAATPTPARRVLA